METRNVALVHGDFHCQNIAFGEGDADPVVFDWQATMANGPATDLVKLVVNSLTAEARREFGDALLEVYLDEFSRTGAELPMSDA